MSTSTNFLVQSVTALTVFSLGLLILSSVILGSANKLEENKPVDEQQLKNIKRSSLILLLISIGLVLLSIMFIYITYRMVRQKV
jgi:hypothetical protein